jgi:hypothetical protein
MASFEAALRRYLVIKRAVAVALARTVRRLQEEYDGNNSFYCVFVKMIFSQHFGLFLEQIGQQHLDYF